MQRWGKLKWVMGQRMKLLPLPLLLLPALQGKMQWLQLMMGPLLLVVLVDLFGDPVKLLLLPPLLTHYVDLGRGSGPCWIGDRLQFLHWQRWDGVILCEILIIDNVTPWRINHPGCTHYYKIK
uniref:Uncharacterized protein n=1 Tax=Picea glauca TaxID=3330 RepID=A0A101LX29_PICGL|nr:hypothetical protein ABT39_MTgene6362 [Picea glauca]QHR86317.1 hypothetical protein Q903MT_gene316 [Picea sitchensis]